VVVGNADPTGGFTYQDDTYTTIAVLGATTTTANAINDSDVVAGDYTTSSGQFGFTEQAGTYTSIQEPGSTQTEISAINDSGVVAGTYESPGDNGIDVGFLDQTAPTQISIRQAPTHCDRRNQ